MGITYFGGGTVPLITQKISDPQIASAIICTGACVFSGIILRSNRKDNITVNIYDGVDDTGRLIALPDMILSKRSISNIWTLSYTPPIDCIDGIYVKVTIPTGAVVSYQVTYDQG